MQKKFIISLGGSLVVPKGGIDYLFLKKFRKLIVEYLDKGFEFFIIVGGGRTCRDYVSAARKVLPVQNDDLDWLGIHSSRLNAHLLRTIFKNEADPEIIKNPTIKLKTKKKLIIAAGWKPGWSTDYVAATLAREYGIKSIVNLSNIDFVFDKDPTKFADARPLEKIDWKSFRRIVGNEWIPGMNAPFDPIASRLASKIGLKVAIINGKNIKEIKNFFEDRKFVGTIIE
jgi:uridylate kinase